MKNDDENEFLWPTGNNGGKRDAYGAFCLYSMLRTENCIFIFWAIVSFLAVYVLMLDDRLTSCLSEANKALQASIFVFSKINDRTNFDSDLANAHFFLMSISIPIQLIMLFMIPDIKIASGAQRKNRNGLLWVVILFAFLLATILIIGPAISVRYLRVLGENNIIALSNFAITIGFSYLVRVAAIVLSNKNRSESC